MNKRTGEVKVDGKIVTYEAVDAHKGSSLEIELSNQGYSKGVEYSGSGFCIYTYLKIILIK